MTRNISGIWPFVDTKSGTAAEAKAACFEMRARAEAALDGPNPRTWWVAVLVLANSEIARCVEFEAAEARLRARLLSA